MSACRTSGREPKKHSQKDTRRHQAMQKVHDGVSDEDGVVNTRQRAARQDENKKKEEKKDTWPSEKCMTVYATRMV